MRAASLVILCLSLGGAVSASWAACNAIPTQTSQLVGGPNPERAAVSLTTAVLEDQQKFESTRHKGALGRIDRVLLSEERGGPVRVAFDGQCVSGAYGTPLAVTGTKDLVAAAVFPGEGEKSSALLTTGDGPSCEALTKGQKPAIEGCRDGGISRGDAKMPVLSLAFPPTTKAAGARTARIAVFRATSVERTAAILARVATTACS